MKIRIGHLSTFYHTSILMIACNTLMDVEWKLFGTGPEIMNAFQRGELELAYIGLPPAIIGMDRGVNIKSIAGGHIEGTVICGHEMFNPTTDIKELLYQFRGYTLGVPGKGSIHDVIITDAIERLNLSSKVKIINFRWADTVLESLHRGEIVAAVGTPALAVGIMRHAGGKILYPPSSLWPNNPSYGIVARTDFIKKGEGSLTDFLIKHEEATEFLRKRPNEAARIIADYVKVVDYTFVLNTLSISPKYCAALTEEYMASTMEFVNVLKRLGYIKRDFQKEDIFDTSMIETIHPEKPHY